ncbi:DUF4376 domain-containing protein [Pseudoalteromonas xiamenensis]|uniref:DUF4376 domain-containing protein n=1 Tax=Pseudoalteromonas xiamenensis TaxID=882626 RepID=UPI0027E4A9E2|nr:hypothetical protein [Pseudoalteromonas xiamenensis]WMN59283.1 DUF4376 domain-containing protein [Pseudoalteromonas xiamenensis]
MTEPLLYIEQPIITYADVQQKIMLRHGQDQIDDALRVAIEQEDAAHVTTHAAWLELLPQVQAEISDVEQYNAEHPDEPKKVPSLPIEPVLDMSKRRSCYRVELVEVDLELSTETSHAEVIFDDDKLIAYHHPATEAHSNEHIALVKRLRFKESRKAALAAQIVEVEGMRFDADETSQQRMARTLLILDETESVDWVLSDNSVAKVTKAQLKAACKLAVSQQTALWIPES